MTKIAIIADQHWGVRNDAPCFISNRVKFLREVFFPAIDDEKVEVILDAGDLTDRRKGITYKTAQTLRTEFLEPIARREIRSHFVVGNHDVSAKNHNGTNALSELVDGRYPLIDVHTDPHEIIVDAKRFLLLPWICDENRIRSMEAIASSKADIVLGHLEMAGFRHYKNTPVASHGMDAGMFSKFDAVWSGHYHHGSQIGNFRYLGAAGEYTWSDHQDDRGFHIYDTETNELDHWRNPFTVFEQIEYDAGQKSHDDKFDPSGKIIRVIVKDRGKSATFDKFVKALEDGGAEDVTIIDQPPKIEHVETVSVAEGDDMLTLLKNSVSELKITVDTEALNGLLEGVYREAVQGI